MLTFFEDVTGGIPPILDDFSESAAAKTTWGCLPLRNFVFLPSNRLFILIRQRVLLPNFRGVHLLIVYFVSWGFQLDFVHGPFPGNRTANHIPVLAFSLIKVQFDDSIDRSCVLENLRNRWGLCDLIPVDLQGYRTGFLGFDFVELEEVFENVGHFGFGLNFEDDFFDFFVGLAGTAHHHYSDFVHWHCFDMIFLIAWWG